MHTTTSTPDARLAHLASRSFGLFTRAQAQRLGFTDRMLRWRVQRGDVEQLSRKVFRFVAVDRTWHQVLLAACWSAGSAAVASHRSAAALHGFDGVTSGVIELTIPHTRWHRRPGVVVHRSTMLPTGDVTRIGPIPVTTPARTIFDLGSVLAPGTLEEVLDVGERDVKVNARDVGARLVELRGPGRTGTTVVADVLTRRVTAAIPESVLERRFLRLLARGGLPAPVAQHTVTRPDGRQARLDFAYPEIRLAIELHGHIAHATRAQRTHDARRSNAVVVRGWRVLVFTWEDITQRANDVLATLRDALEGAAA
jgi:hypothetical protein